MDPQAPQPLSAFQSDGKPDSLSSNLPEPGSYNGRNYIDLGVPEDWFANEARRLKFKVPPEVSDPTKLPQLLRDITLAMKNGFDSQVSNVDPVYDKYFPDVPAELRRQLFYAGPLPGGDPKEHVVLPDQRPYSGVYVLSYGIPTIDSLSVDLQTLTPAEVLSALVQGKRLKIVQDLYGKYSYTFLPVWDPTRPMLALVEQYRLTTFLGSYGASRTIKTLSLLPGEKTKITINSYTRRSETLKQTSSILDSLTKESADDFQNTVEKEATDKQTAARSDEWQVDAKVQGRWGTGSVSLGAGAAGSINSSREQVAKNVTNAVQKHAAKVSSKRSVNVDLSSETKTESGEETGTVREIQNANVGRVINFVFRQMSQEYFSLLHLVDVGIAFTNGQPGDERIVPLWKIDSLLADVIADPANRTQLKNQILRELKYVRDYQDKYQKFYEEFSPTGNPTDAYFRPRIDLKYSFDVRGTTVTVPGILLGVSMNVMYTNGVIVDTILGQSEALDDYSKRVRDTATQGEKLANDLVESDLAIEQLRQGIVLKAQTEQAAAFAAMFPAQTRNA